MVVGWRCHLGSCFVRAEWGLGEQCAAVGFLGAGNFIGGKCQVAVSTIDRLRVASIASASSHSAKPRFAMSFIKNSPSADKTGKPPADASPTPGVVTMKLSVVTKNSEAKTPPTTEAFGNHGLTASSAAVINSIDPFNRPKASMDMMLYTQLKRGLL